MFLGLFDLGLLVVLSCHYSMSLVEPNRRSSLQPQFEAGHRQKEFSEKFVLASKDN